MDLRKVSARCVQNSLWLTRGSGGVKNVERMFAAEFFGGAVGVDGGHQLVQPEITSRLNVLFGSGSFGDDTAFDRRRYLQRCVNSGLEFYCVGATSSAVRSDDEFAT